MVVNALISEIIEEYFPDTHDQLVEILKECDIDYRGFITSFDLNILREAMEKKKSDYLEEERIYRDIEYFFRNPLSFPDLVKRLNKDKDLKTVYGNKKVAIRVNYIDKFKRD